MKTFVHCHDCDDLACMKVGESEEEPDVFWYSCKHADFAALAGGKGIGTSDLTPAWCPLEKPATPDLTEARPEDVQAFGGMLGKGPHETQIR